MQKIRITYRNHAQAHVQVKLRIPLAKVFFLQTSTIVFLPCDVKEAILLQILSR